MSVSYSCTFATPRLYDGTVPTGNQQQWQFLEETCVYNDSMYAPTTTISSENDILLYGSITAGEMIMSVFMLMLIVIELFKMISQSLNKINTKRKFLGYSGGDVEVREDL